MRMVRTLEFGANGYEVERWLGVGGACRSPRDIVEEYFTEPQAVSRMCYPYTQGALHIFLYSTVCESIASGRDTIQWQDMAFEMNRTQGYLHVKFARYTFLHPSIFLLPSTIFFHRRLFNSTSHGNKNLQAHSS